MSIREKLLALGPGLIMAGAVIGASHLVQSTRAGALYGTSLLGLVLLTNALKYPFFEAGHRYTAATGETLLRGYRRLGRGWLYLFLALNLPLAAISLAGVTFVTAAIAHYLLPSLSLVIWAAIILALSALCLLWGGFRGLDRSMRGLMLVLSLGTVAALLLALLSPVPPTASTLHSASPWSAAALPFLIALMGWMPGPIEVSAWQSLWVKAQERCSGRRTTLTEALWDFNFGYILSAALALIFVLLGALMLYRTGVEPESSPAGFVAQLIGIYGTTLGRWSEPLIAAAALATMLSTTISVTDGYPRSLACGVALLSPRARLHQRTLFALLVIGTALVSLLIISVFASNLKGMVDFAASVSFVAAPVFALLNVLLLRAQFVPDAARPGPVLNALSILGLLFLSGFALLFLTFRFVAS